MGETILVVDDSSSMRALIKSTLEEEGYRVHEAHNGQVGLQELSNVKPALVISDLNMPVMDGLTMVSKAKELPDFKFTPFLMLTTESGEKSKSIGRSVGASAWLVKPFNPEKLILAIKRLI